MQRDFTSRDLERAHYGFLENNFWGRSQKAKKNQNSKLYHKGRDSYMKGAGILVISLRVVKCRFCWSHSGRKAVQYFYP